MYYVGTKMELFTDGHENIFQAKTQANALEKGTEWYVFEDKPENVKVTGTS